MQNNLLFFFVLLSLRETNGINAASLDFLSDTRIDK
jgi:hypothetical protein